VRSSTVKRERADEARGKGTQRTPIEIRWGSYCGGTIAERPRLVMRQTSGFAAGKPAIRFSSILFCWTGLSSGEDRIEQVPRAA
jgi:hypothetical protein